MTQTARVLQAPADLRAQANARLSGGHAQPTHPGEQASQALRVLHGLATSPDTAPDALAVLHELQVHQVELELQADMLQASHAEMDAALKRLKQLYDCAPVPYFTMARDTRVADANAVGARCLGVAPSAMPGFRLDGVLSPACRLHELVARVVPGSEEVVGEVLMLQRVGSATASEVWVSLAPDPASKDILITLTPIAR